MFNFGRKCLKSISETGINKYKNYSANTGALGFTSVLDCPKDAFFRFALYPKEKKIMQTCLFGPLESWGKKRTHDNSMEMLRKKSKSRDQEE